MKGKIISVFSEGRCYVPEKRIKKYIGKTVEVVEKIMPGLYSDKTITSFIVISPTELKGIMLFESEFKSNKDMCLERLSK